VKSGNGCPFTTALPEQDGRTTLGAGILYASSGIRDGLIKSSMESGMNASDDWLSERPTSMR